MTDQAMAGNDVESTSDQLSAPSGSVNVTQVETVSDGNPTVLPSEKIASVAIGTHATLAMQVCQSQLRMSVNK